MAKDPAILWYWNDWQGGTMTLTRHLKGCYMDILSAQFNQGPLSLEEIKAVLGSDFGQAWPTLLKKFAVDEAGKYSNERMELERVKRAQYKQFQSDSGKKGAAVRWKHGDANDDPNSNPNGETVACAIENENEVTSKVIKVRFIKPELNEVTAYFLNKEVPQSEAEEFMDYYKSNGWRVGKNPMKDWESAANRWIRGYKQKNNEKYRATTTRERDKGRDQLLESIRLDQNRA